MPTSDELELETLAIPTSNVEVENTSGERSPFAPEYLLGRLISEGHDQPTARKITNTTTLALDISRPRFVTTAGIRHFSSELLRGTPVELATEILSVSHTIVHVEEDTAELPDYGVGKAAIALLDDMIVNPKFYGAAGNRIAMLTERAEDIIIANEKAAPTELGTAKGRQKKLKQSKKNTGEDIRKKTIAELKNRTGEMFDDLRRRVESGGSFNKVENGDLVSEWELVERLIYMYQAQSTPWPGDDDMVFMGEGTYAGSDQFDYPKIEHEFEKKRFDIKPASKQEIAKVKVRSGVQVYIGSRIVFEDDGMSPETAKEWSDFFSTLFGALLDGATEVAVEAADQVANPGLPPAVWSKVTKLVKDKAKEEIKERTDKVKSLTQEVIEGWLGPEVFPPFPCLIVTEWTPGKNPKWHFPYQGSLLGRPSTGEAPGKTVFNIAPLNREKGGKYRFYFEFEMRKA